MSMYLRLRTEPKDEQREEHPAEIAEQLRQAFNAHADAAGVEVALPDADVVKHLLVDALGALAEDGKIRLVPEGGTAYVVTGDDRFFWWLAQACQPVGNGFLGNQLDAVTGDRIVLEPETPNRDQRARSKLAHRTGHATR